MHLLSAYIYTYTVTFLLEEKIQKKMNKQLF